VKGRTFASLVAAGGIARVRTAITAWFHRAIMAVLVTLLVACAASRGTARSAPGLHSATGHVMKYTVSLPAGWTRDRTWPVVVVIPDATRDFAGNLAEFAAAGASTPFIFVAPHVVTSGGSSGYRAASGFRYSDADWGEVDRLGDFRFDEEGLVAVVADVHARFNGDEQVYLTGWEAGGHTVWGLLLRHPERYRAVAPVSTNYLGRWLGATQPVPSATATPPVKVFFCGTGCAPEDARQGLLTQTRAAISAARARGFGEIPIEVREGTHHGPLAVDVLAWFTSQPGRPR
jgi:poly(3-hydroxybutyrate) depolymerase